MNKPNLTWLATNLWQPRQVGAVQGVLALLDPLLRRATAIVKADYAFWRVAQVGHDETNPGEQLATMPLYLGHHSPGQVPTLSLVGKVVVGDDRLVRRPLIGRRQQVLDLLLQYIIGGKSDDVPNLSLFQVSVQLWPRLVGAASPRNSSLTPVSW